MEEKRHLQFFFLLLHSLIMGGLPPTTVAVVCMSEHAISHFLLVFFAQTFFFSPVASIVKGGLPLRINGLENTHIAFCRRLLSVPRHKNAFSAPRFNGRSDAGTCVVELVKPSSKPTTAMMTFRPVLSISICQEEDFSFDLNSDGGKKNLWKEGCCGLQFRFPSKVRERRGDHPSQASASHLSL